MFASDFQRLPVNQPHSYDGPSESRGGEASFLDTVEFLRLKSLEFPIPSPFDGELLKELCVCVCSFHAPHVGAAEAERVQFWQELVAMAKRVHAFVCQ